MGIVICISGSAGTGKTTQAKILAEKYKLKYISAGSIFRDIAKERNLSLEELSQKVLNDNSIDLEIDRRTKELACKGDVLLEGRLTAWMTKELDAFRIFLTCPLEIQIKRVAERDHKDYDEAKRETLKREESELVRYRQIYGIDIRDLNIYDIVVNTALFPVKTVSKILFTVVNEYIKLRG